MRERSTMLMAPLRRIVSRFGGAERPSDSLPNQTIQWQVTPSGSLLFDGQEHADHSWSLQEMLDIADVCWCSATHIKHGSPTLAMIAIQPGVATSLWREGDITRESLLQATPGPAGSLELAVTTAYGKPLKVRIQRETRLSEVEFHTDSGFIF